MEEFFLRDNDTTQRKQLYDLLVANGYDRAFLRKSDSVYTPDETEINKDETKEEDNRYSEDDIEDYRLTDTTQTLITEIIKEETVDETKTRLQYKGRK